MTRSAVLLFCAPSMDLNRLLQKHWESEFWSPVPPFPLDPDSLFVPFIGGKCCEQGKGCHDVSSPPFSRFILPGLGSTLKRPISRFCVSLQM